MKWQFVKKKVMNFLMYGDFRTILYIAICIRLPSDKTAMNIDCFMRNILYGSIARTRWKEGKEIERREDLIRLFFRFCA
jgi:hypothetical protein